MAHPGNDALRLMRRLPGRNKNHFGEAESRIHFFGNGEISRDRLYAYTGVLAVFP